MATKPQKKRTKEGKEKEDDGDGRKRPRKGSAAAAILKKRKTKPGDPGYDPYDFTSSEEDEEDTPTAQSHDQSHDQGGSEEMEVEPGPVRLNDERYASSCSF